MPPARRRFEHRCPACNLAFVEELIGEVITLVPADGAAGQGGPCPFRGGSRKGTKRKRAKGSAIHEDDCFCNLLVSCFVLHELTRLDPTPPLPELADFIRDKRERCS